MIHTENVNIDAHSQSDTDFITTTPTQSSNCMFTTKSLLRTAVLIGSSYSIYSYSQKQFNSSSFTSSSFLSSLFVDGNINADFQAKSNVVTNAHLNGKDDGGKDNGGKNNGGKDNSTSDTSNSAINDTNITNVTNNTEDILARFGSFNPNLPTFSLDDVIKHNTKESGIWVTYKNGVYDITQFVNIHPGGYDKIRLAFGGAVDPFWEIYGQHKVEHVLNLLEEHRIGNLSKKDAQIVKSTLGTDAYANDPSRHPALVERSKKPFNAETPNDFLGGDSFYTPNQMFYVRNHLSVPVINPSEYRLRVSGKGVQAREFTLEELKTLFSKKKVVSTVQCAGNRRDEMNKNTDKKVSGLVWDIGAIGNAEWTGAPLREILQYCGFENDVVNVEHVWFEGLDIGAENNSYGASIPIDKAVDEKGDVILAYEMNGEPIPRDHGYPVRAICPGIVGARNVKWVGAIITSEEESPSHWQQRDYKGFGPNIPLEKIDWDSAPSIQELPVQSAISSPRDGERIDPAAQDELKITGYAYSGGGRNIIRVDVSTDGGKTWQQARLKEKPIAEKRNQAWSWTLWELPVEIPENAEEMEIVVKAIDSSYNAQPETSSPIWNARGVLSNAWHRVKVEFAHDDEEEV